MRLILVAYSEGERYQIEYYGWDLGDGFMECVTRLEVLIQE